ncbi:unnamed protein product [Microthlaspi erraticum]|uniref:non-specific serine/threonine protein kinase n=1 Tax=Microthlaspi erraticum TaxID=1685480 RepID=A0A6D2I094_9BRAS|nr:unnamed protein product [Microthlaspi erraticum]
MLTTSLKKQLYRLSAIANHIASDDKIEASLQSHSASAMLALTYILSLEKGSSAESSFSEIAVPMILRATKLCYHLRPMLSNEGEAISHPAKCNLTKWNGLLDGCIGLLESRLKWGGPLTVQQHIASGTPLLLINLKERGCASLIPDVKNSTTIFESTSTTKRGTLFSHAMYYTPQSSANGAEHTLMLRAQPPNHVPCSSRRTPPAVAIPTS